MLPTGERSTLVVIKLRNRLQERSGKGNASGDLHCVDGMLEGVSREAGPFEFVVCADGARMGRRERAWAGLCAWAGGWARGPVDDGVRVPGTVRACPGLCAWALLLVVVTPSCAAGPYWWQCGRPAWATTCGVNLRSEGAQASTCPADPAIPVANAAAPASIAFASRRG